MTAVPAISMRLEDSLRRLDEHGLVFVLGFALVGAEAIAARLLGELG